MKFTITPKKFLKLLRFGLIGSGSPLLSQFTVEFDEQEAIIRGFAKDGYIAYHGSFDSKWFLSHEGKDQLVFKTTVLRVIDEKFNKERFIEISTEGEMLWIRSSKKEYGEPLTKQSPKEFPIIMVKTKQGNLPEYCYPVLQLYIEKDELYDKSKSHYGNADILWQIFNLRKEEVVSTTMYDRDRVFIKTLEILDNERNKIGDIEVAFQGRVFQQCLKGLNGKLWLLMDEDVAILSEKGEGYGLTYMIRASRPS